MTGWGEKIPDVSVGDLQERLRTHDDDGKAVKRLFTAIAYKQGLSPADIEETYGISKKNVYLWLDRIEERGLEDALYDDPKPGRPPKLSDSQRDQLQDILQHTPDQVGVDGQTWSPSLVQRVIRDRFGVDYTLRHVRRLLEGMELEWQTPRPNHADPDAPERA